MSVEENEAAFNRWLLQTSERWEDVADVVAITGFSMIDNDHKELVRYILRLNEIITLFADDAVGLSEIEKERELLHDFLNYTVFHFTREEEILTRFKMKDLQKQRDQHKLIVKRIHKTIADFNQGKVVISPALKTELLDWVIDHINNVDSHTFRLENFSPAFVQAKTWDDISVLVENTGLNFVDQEHREITRLLFDFFSTINEESLPINELEIKFTQVISFFKEHFEHEEDFIKQYSLKNLALQQKSHNYFINRLQEMADNIDLKVILDAKVEILMWWVGHINGIDNATFSLSEWVAPLIEMARDADDIAWLIQKTGIDEIDNEHYGFIELGIHLYKLIDNKASHKEIVDAFEKMNHLVINHFKHEELLMEDAEDISVSLHKNEHRKLLSFFEESLEYLRDKRLAFDDKFKVKLVDWWINHTNYIDIKTFGLK